MTPPPRLLESSQNSAAVDLLRAGLRERPRQAARQAAALAVGVSSTVVAASTTATAAAGTTTALVTPSVGMVLAKWLAVGTLGGLGLAGTASVVSEAGSPRTTATTPSARHAGAVERAVEHAAPTRMRASAGDEPRLPSDGPKRSSPVVAAKARTLATTQVAAPAEEPVKPTPPASARLPDAPSLSREIALIDGARRSLVNGDPSGALKKLDDYAALVRTGTLDREAQLLRIDALSQAGQRAAALSLAARYLESHPNDPHAPRLRALLVAP